MRVDMAKSSLAGPGAAHRWKTRHEANAPRLCLARRPAVRLTEPARSRSWLDRHMDLATYEFPQRLRPFGRETQAYFDRARVHFGGRIGTRLHPTSDNAANSTNC